MDVAQFDRLRAPIDGECLGLVGFLAMEYLSVVG
jgi:hypothetical protein